MTPDRYSITKYYFLCKHDHSLQIYDVAFFVSRLFMFICVKLVGDQRSCNVKLNMFSVL